MTPSGSVVLVTGASSGFGLLISQKLAECGHRVYATMRDPEGRNADVAQSFSGAAEVVELDVTSQQSVDAAVERIVADNGRIDVAVNNAGTYYMGLLETFTPEEVLEQVDVNAIGALRVNYAVLPHMRERRSGLLIHISSALGRRALPYSGVYAASKWAMEAIAETHRYELAHLGIDSVIIEPGAFASGLDDRSVVMLDGPRSEDYKALREFGEGVLERRAGAPEAHPVADVVAKLVEARPGERPMRTTVDAPALDRLNKVADEMQAELFENLGVTELMRIRAIRDV